MRRVVGVKLLRANGRLVRRCVFPLPARFFCCQPRCFVRQHPWSAALVLAFLHPPRFFCCQPRCFVRQHPRSAALVLAFPLPARFFCCATALLRPSAPPVCRFSPRISALSVFLLLCNCVSFAVQLCFFCCATALSVRYHPLSRLFFLISRRERLCFAKCPCPPARAPRRYRARGATVFGFSLARFRLATPFFC